MLQKKQTSCSGNNTVYGHRRSISEGQERPLLAKNRPHAKKPICCQRYRGLDTALCHLSMVGGVQCHSALLRGCFAQLAAHTYTLRKPLGIVPSRLRGSRIIAASGSGVKTLCTPGKRPITLLINTQPCHRPCYVEPACAAKVIPPA